MKNCSEKGKSEKAAPCGTYSACQICQYRYFYLGIMRETFGDKLILTQDEQEWVDNVYSKLSKEDLRYVKAKYDPETPTAYRKKSANKKSSPKMKNIDSWKRVRQKGQQRESSWPVNEENATGESQ